MKILNNAKKALTSIFTKDVNKSNSADVIDCTEVHDLMDDFFQKQFNYALTGDAEPNFSEVNEKLNAIGKEKIEAYVSEVKASHILNGLPVSTNLLLREQRAAIKDAALVQDYFDGILSSAPKILEARAALKENIMSQFSMTSDDVDEYFTQIEDLAYNYLEKSNQINNDVRELAL